MINNKCLVSLIDVVFACCLKQISWMINVETWMMFQLEECEDAKPKMQQKRQQLAGTKNNVMQQKQKARSVIPKC